MIVMCTIYQPIWPGAEHIFAVKSATFSFGKNKNWLDSD